VVLACLVATLSYLAAGLGGALIVRPQMVSPLWLGNVFLASVLVLARRRIWPVLLTAGLTGFFLFDLQSGVPIRSIVWFILSNAVEILTAALCLIYSFDGVPRLNSVKALAKYSFYAVFLAPFIGAFFGALSTRNNYWPNWRVAFFSEAIGFLTLMPAILGWAREAPAWSQKPLAYYLEATSLIAGVTFIGYVIFVVSEKDPPPALLYSVVPFLLWAALRFGSMGVSTSVVALAFLSIWGVVHGRGPFTNGGPLSSVFSLQLFLVFFAIPFMVLAALVEERKQAGDKLREGEERFRLVANTAPVMIWMSDTDKLCTYFNTPWLDFTGKPVESELGNGWAEGVHPEDYKTCLETYIKAFDHREKFTMEYRLRRCDQVYRWVLDIGVPRFNLDRSFAGYIGSCLDVTERKLAEEALSSVSRRLIEAQEEERAHLARELHDDLSQRMALLEVSLDQFKQEVSGVPSRARQQLHAIAEVAREVSSNIHGLSHQLHPSKLDTLGLEASLMGLCREFTGQHNLQVQFVHNDIPRHIPKNVTLCLFRIAQEALRNVVKHSGALEAKVELSSDGDQIDLCISDSGAGFSPDSAKGISGLGIVSMRERLRLVDGHLSIESEPWHETQIRVRVPLPTINARPTGEGNADQAEARASSAGTSEAVTRPRAVGHETLD
jgi:PAS domain S-box-containing protein